MTGNVILAPFESNYISWRYSNSCFFSEASAQFISLKNLSSDNKFSSDNGQQNEFFPDVRLLCVDFVNDLIDGYAAILNDLIKRF